MNRPPFAPLTLPMLLLVAGCSGGGGSTAKPTPTLAISPTTATLAYGTTQVFIATGANFGTAHWSVQEAGGGAISGTGTQATYTAPATTGTYHVVVKGDDPTVQASAEVRVFDSLDYLSLVMTPHVMHVQLSDGGGVFPGGENTFLAQVKTVHGGAKSKGRKEVIPPPPGDLTGPLAGSFLEDAPVTWTLQEGPVAGVVNPATGEYTPTSVPGIYHLVATRKDDPTISGAIEVIVRAPAAPYGGTTGDDFAIYPDRSIMEPDGEAYLKMGSGVVNWTLAEGAAAGTLTVTGGSDQEVKYSAPATPGVFTAIATNTLTPFQKAQGLLEVGRRVSVSVAPGVVKVAPGSTTTFSVQVGNTTQTAVNWKVVEGANAGSLAGTGSSVVYTAPPTPGKYHVQAALQADPLRHSEALVEVTGTGTVSVQVLNPPLRIEAGAQVVCVAAVAGTGNTGVTWSASGGTITADGLWTAPSTSGPATVTATSLADPTKTGSATITVARLPRFTSVPPTRANLDLTPYTYTPIASHPDGLLVTLAKEQAPAGVTLAGTTLSWSPTPAQGSLTNTFILRATDSLGGIGRQQWSVEPLLAQMLAFVSSSLYGKADATTGSMVRIRPDGSYIQGQANPADGGGKPGVEVGVTTIAGFDANGFWHSPGVTSVDTNGDWGLSHPQPCDRFRVVANQLQDGGCPGDPWTTLPIMENQAAGIVGVWAVGSANAVNTPHISFFSNGRYLFLDTSGDGSCGVPGVEFGSYVHNAGTLTASNNLYDTTGCTGLHHPGSVPAYPTFQFVLAADGKSAILTEPGFPAITVYRVSK